MEAFLVGFGAFVVLLAFLLAIFFWSQKAVNRARVQPRWYVETSTSNDVLFVYLRMRNRRNLVMQALTLGSVDVSIEEDWSEQIDTLIATANDKAGLLNAQLPGPSAG